MVTKSGLCIGGGSCEECGRCNLYDTTTRKKKLTNLPDNFEADIQISEDENDKCYGVAFDIGTTTVVGMLWDLKEKRLVDMIAKTNPQSRYGADVISRITFTLESPENLNLLQTMIIECFNGMLDAFSLQYQIQEAWIQTATVVGNTTMSHLFLGIDPASLARSPFEPGFYGPALRSAQEMGIHMDPKAEIYILPNIAGHVGSDIVGVMLASGIKERTGVNLAIDIGTNGEIVLSGAGKMYACSTAAGPAFEGAGICNGMRAADGAIEKVAIQDGKISIKVIGNSTPVGICGSGLIDAIAQMLDGELINFKGNLLSAEEASIKGVHPELIKRLRKGVNGKEFVLVWKTDNEDIVINQNDIREVQLAKGAIFGGIQVLLQCLNADAEELEEILLAGAFGSYIDKKSALRIGLIPNIDIEKIQHIGNAAGVGACMALLSKKIREQANQQSNEIEHVELALHPGFEKEYLNGMYFPKEAS